jgi:hypothetical protein
VLPLFCTLLVPVLLVLVLLVPVHLVPVHLVLLLLVLVLLMLVVLVPVLLVIFAPTHELTLALSPLPRTPAHRDDVPTHFPSRAAPCPWPCCCLGRGPR